MTVDAGDELPVMDHAGRRDRVRARLTEAGIDALLVTDPANVRYLSGFSGSNGQLLLSSAFDDRLVTDDRYTGRAATESPGIELTLSRDPAEVALRASRSARLAIEAEHVTLAAAESLRERGSEQGTEVVGSTGIVESLREVKDAAEIARLALACELTVAAMAWLFAEVVAPGRTERELAIALERSFIDRGADGVAFPSIVAGGPNAAVPHHLPSARPLEVGDLLTVDCGALVDGYHADCTRTVAVGHLDDDLAAVHELVQRAQAAGREAAVAGATSGDVDAAARTVIEEAGHGERFVHGTGHGVGLRIHEAPAVARGARATLRGGTALTVEPGVYLPGIGGVRIEDTIVVTADGPARILTDIPRDLRVLPGRRGRG
jgi:Xaa-Pro aminopeptidase